ncbi:MAG: hypothetical protein HY513_01480 [Candidatus Aenigmarchaeota archaeon]|nr:hypothetical protein [Candidatus Aenigmarchaeota archaeon]
MNKGSYYILIALMALVLATGCTGGRSAKVDVNNGVTITDFSASPTQANDGDFVLLDIEFENTGGTTARNVQVDLYGVEGQWRDSFGNLITSTLTQNFGTLRRPIPERNIPGDFRLANFNIMTKDVPEGISPVLPIEARVTYDYNTSGHLQLYAMSEGEYRRKTSLGEPFPTAEIINSAGPIKLDLADRYRQPAIINSVSQGDPVQIIPIKIVFTNVGNGFPITEINNQITGLGGAGGRLTGTIDLFAPAGIEFDNCLGTVGGHHIDLDTTQIPLQLRESGTVPVACTLKVDKATWGDRPIDTIQLVFNIFYRYYTYSRVNVQVIGE